MDQLLEASSKFTHMLVFLVYPFRAFIGLYMLMVIVSTHIIANFMFHFSLLMVIGLV